MRLFTYLLTVHIPATIVPQPESRPQPYRDTIPESRHPAPTLETENHLASAFHNRHQGSLTPQQTYVMGQAPVSGTTDFTNGFLLGHADDQNLQTDASSSHQQYHVPKLHTLAAWSARLPPANFTEAHEDGNRDRGSDFLAAVNQNVHDPGVGQNGDIFSQTRPTTAMPDLFW
jgi:hypothetical protein